MVPVAMLLAALPLASCGEESGEANGPTVSQRITTEFGHNLIASNDDEPLDGHGTMMRLLKEDHEVGTRYHGNSVYSIDGRAYDAKKGTTTWASFVNGVETDEFPADYKLYAGDVVNWDLRAWDIELDVRAIVGAFPEFFTHGFNGKRIPMRVLCEKPGSEACIHVKKVLRAAGVPLDKPPARPASPDTIQYTGRIVVGKWNHWRERPWPARIDKGPVYSGVFARFNEAGDELRLLDWKGDFVRAERGDVGLVAAMRPTEADFMWVVSGTSDRGVLRAARALAPDRLRDAFTLAVLPDEDVKLPLEPPN
jgi:hypothetical protein